MLLRFILILLATIAGSKVTAEGMPAAGSDAGATPGIPQRYIVVILAELVVLVLVTVLILIKVRRIGRK